MIYVSMTTRAILVVLFSYASLSASANATGAALRAITVTTMGVATAPATTIDLTNQLSREDSLAIQRASLRMSMLYDSGRFIQDSWKTRNSVESEFATDGKRSVPLAFGLSAIIPGTGQAYNKQWIKAAVAISIEAVLIATYISKKNEGEELEDAFIAFAHQDWDPGRYGDWLNDYTVFLNAEFGAGISVPDINTEIGVDFQHPESWSSENRQAVQAMINQINNTERNVFHPETGASFAHQLPGFGEQQYYELIGKYFQFAPGWSDYPAWIDEDGNFTVAIDPEHSGPNGSKPNVSDKFFTYAEDHAESQDFFRSASRYGLLIALNHVVSAIDAAVISKLHNDRISTRLSLAPSRTGVLAPSVGIGIRL